MYVRVKVIQGIVYQHQLKAFFPLIVVYLKKKSHHTIVV